ncbi:uncharacterized protein LOC131876294 [Cryptomeria japonica]|uniref:uncharacterized protein LOC131876294 n=1 Tax=Cryptomeria japonica TaxID=3369 RepID=UPI0027DA8E69|nr:uncharacterized protein LOC131876294 [Cryptomeria japonica]
MAKAYDRVKWSFLRKILLAFGFNLEWVSWVLSCVTSASFYVLVNCQPSQLFGASIGLRKGDPLSPYLFIIMVEGLGRFIKSWVSQGLILGWTWGVGLPKISHLYFVDDTTLIGVARIPLSVGWQLRPLWQDLLDKLHRKVNHSTHRWLSIATCVTLLQFVIQALPIHKGFVQATLMYFLKEFDALSRQFLWSGHLLSSKWSLVKWESICRPKSEGGLGLHSAVLHSQVLATKLYKRWCTNQHQLWARILTFKWKGPSEWLPGGSKDSWQELANILASRNCSSLEGLDILAWGSDSFGKYSIVVGYLNLLHQIHGEEEVTWWKQVWNRFAWPKSMRRQSPTFSFSALSLGGFGTPGGTIGIVLVGMFPL